jgi:hypothetical protein
MNAIFIDTAGFLALWNARDQWNERATEVFVDLMGRGEDFCTSSYIMLECGNAAARQPFRRDVIEVREQFLADGKLIIPGADDEAAAWKVFARGHAADAGIVDHISFTIMRRLGITRAFTNDRHFRAAGFETLF